MRSIYIKLSAYENIAIQKLLENKKITFFEYLMIFFKSIFYLIEGLIRNIPGPIGIVIRRSYYKYIFIKMGKNVLISTDVIFHGPQNINCGNFVWFDSYSVYHIEKGNLLIGNHVSLHSHVCISGRSKIVISDYCALSSGAKIFSTSIKIFEKEKKIFHSMLPDSATDINTAEVFMEENSVMLPNSSIGPGVTLKKGTIILNNSSLNKNSENYGIYNGNPAILIGKRY